MGTLTLLYPAQMALVHSRSSSVVEAVFCRSREFVLGQVQMVEV